MGWKDGDPQSGTCEGCNCGGAQTDDDQVEREAVGAADFWVWHRWQEIAFVLEVVAGTVKLSPP